jgi:hypothetical protein
VKLTNKPSIPTAFTATPVYIALHTSWKQGF